MTATAKATAKAAAKTPTRTSSASSGSSASSASASGLVVARYTFVTERVRVAEGSLWAADHPTVLAHPDLFRDAAEVAIRP